MNTVAASVWTGATGLRYRVEGQGKRQYVTILDPAGDTILGSDHIDLARGTERRNLASETAPRDTQQVLGQVLDILEGKPPATP